MSDDPLSLRSDTQALTTLIEATVQKARDRSDDGSLDTMLFLGNGHQAIPTLVVQDPILEPVDKLVWMAMMIQARETGGRAAFPSYASLARHINVGSTSTISRAIALLRITRWLTLCARVRDAQGQFRGNVYALHDEPLPLVDTLYLDATYMDFLQQSQAHHHARVCRVAKGLFESLDEDIQAGRDVMVNMSQLERRAQTAAALRATTPQRYFAFSARVRQRLNNGIKTSRNYQDQNSKAVDSSIAGSSSDLSKNTTTTTVAGNHAAHQEEMPASCDGLIYPSRLCRNQRALAERYLAIAPVAQHQAILDELEGRLQSEHKGMAPLYDELRFLFALCKAAQQGEFVSNLGIKVGQAREERYQAALANNPQLSLLANPVESKKTSVTPQGEEQLKVLRQSLGLSVDKPE